METHRSILEQIDADAIAEDTLAFIKVKSETGQEGAGSEFLANLLRREGFEVSLDEVEPGRPNIYTRVQGVGNGGRSLLFNGHTDTSYAIFAATQYILRHSSCCMSLGFSMTF